MNIVWSVATIASLVVLIATQPQSVLPLCLESCSQALAMAFGLCGVYCLWMGIFQIAQDCRLVEKLSQCLGGLNRLLYGKVSAVAQQYVSLNFASNLLGVGNAATPSAIAAMQQMETQPTLSRSGAMLFVVNACGVQLVPTTVIGLRAQAGATNAADILLPNLLVTLFTFAAGVALVFVFYGRAGQNEQTRQLCCKNSTKKALNAKVAMSGIAKRRQGRRAR